MLPQIGGVELVLILVIVTMLFGVGKLPEIFSAVGKGVREFRHEATVPEGEKTVYASERTGRQDERCRLVRSPAALWEWAT